MREVILQPETILKLQSSYTVLKEIHVHYSWFRIVDLVTIRVIQADMLIPGLGSRASYKKLFLNIQYIFTEN